MPLPIRVTQILSIHTPVLLENALTQACDRLRSGDVVAIPTETVYGLAAHALDANAVSKVFQMKGRPAHNPVIVHVDTSTRARTLTALWPETATLLARKFWPGALTLVLRHNDQVPDIVTAHGATIGIRVPAHPFVRELVNRCDFPLAAPSANLSNRLSPTNADHVFKQLNGKLGLIIDGGPCQVGIESTVVDLTARHPRLLRPGMIPWRAILDTLGLGEPSPERVGGEELISDPDDHSVLRSPGMMEKHYSPNARLVVRAWESDDDLMRQVNELGFSADATCIVAHSRIPMEAKFLGTNIIPNDAEAFGRALYGQLHRCDDEGARLIVIEQPPPSAEWDAIRDRLTRAAADD